MTLALDVVGLKKKYGTKPVLTGVDLCIEPGHLVGYVGANGSGKTTTFRILAGLQGGFEGEVRVAGHDVLAEPDAVKQDIGYVPESGALYEVLTLAETLLLFGRLHRMEDAVIRTRGEALLKAFDLLHVAGYRVAVLSKGMRQKLLIATALLHDPPVLILDEPLAGLDVQSSLLVRALLRRFVERGRTVLVSSHAVGVLQELCDEIAILHEGQILAHGRFETIAANLRARSLEDLMGGLAGEDDALREARLDALLDVFSS